MIVSQVFHNSETAQKPSPIGAQSQLEKLRTDLLHKREASVEQGQVQDIQMIDKALTQVETALKDVVLNQKIASSQARLGQIKPATQAINVQEKEAPKLINEKEAEQIKAIRSIQSKEISPGQQFASMQGREPSNISYMKTNIQGLFDLVALKA